MTGQLNIYKGRKGADGSNGENGLGIGDVGSKNLDQFRLSCLHNNNLSNDAFITYSRDSVDTFSDRYGNVEFTMPPSVTNYVDYSENFNEWFDLFNLWTITGTATDPFGGSDATEITLDADTDDLVGVGPVIRRGEDGWAAGGYLVVSFYIQYVSGTLSEVELSFGSEQYNLGSVSASWEKKTIKVPATSTGFTLAINPRGKAGAVFNLYGVQISDVLIGDYIKTNGQPITRNYPFNLPYKANEKGYLIEGPKQNLCHNTNDFTDWTISGGAVAQYSGKDAFGFINQKCTVQFSSLSTITLNTTAETLTNGVTYKVSVYAFTAGGSLNSITVSLAGGDAIALPSPSVNGFTRLTFDVIAGSGSGLELTLVSEALNAQVNLCGWQIETSEVSSYIESSTIGQSRLSDVVSLPYAYNVPKPSDNWTLVFTLSDLIINSDNKVLFTNAESTANEFSFSIADNVFTLNNGGNTATFSYDLTVNQYALKYDGVNLYFYKGSTLSETKANGSTSFIANDFYVGSNNGVDSINASLKDVQFYTTALSDNELFYLMGE